MTEKLYKVLLDGKSCHKSSMEWSLPTEAGPGDWHSVELPLSECENGFHLIKDPSKWWKPGASCFEVEVGGQVLDYDTNNHKIYVEKVKLVRLLPDSELLSSFDLNVLIEGEHVVKTGLVYASGSASVRAFGSASVEAFGNALVSVRGDYSSDVITILNESSVLVDYRNDKPITSTDS